MSAHETAVALAGLLRVCEPPSAALSAFTQKVGPVAAWEGVLARRAPRAVLAATSARTAHVPPAELIARAERDLAVAGGCGARIIGADDAEWPAAALHGFAGALARGVRGAGPPFALYLRGRALTGLPVNGVTIVGSRASSAYGQRVTGEMAYELAASGLVVVSGAAFGIDTAAHRAALQAARTGLTGSRPSSAPVTVAVLACGIDRAYPEANRVLLDEIGGCGSVVSEYPPGTTPARHRFLVRNRLIAALGAGTVVVEAGRRSGTLSTAAAAEQLGRVVMAIPGPVTSAMSVGCHLLLADRFAQLVTGAGDVLAAVGLAATGATTSDGASSPGVDPAHPTDGLDPVTARVYDALPAVEMTSVEEMVVESGLPPNEVIGSLALLELHGMTVKEGASWRRVTRTGKR
jgi:DNA processing protein